MSALAEGEIVLGSIEAWETPGSTISQGTKFSSFEEQHASMLRDTTGEIWLSFSSGFDFTPTSVDVYLAQGQPERAWSPWAYHPPTENLRVSSLGLGAVASGIVLFDTSLTDVVDATDVLPVPRVHRLVNPGQIVGEPTPISERGSVIIFSPGLRPRRVGVHDFVVPAPTELPRRSQEALGAVSDLMTWLDRTRDEIADIAQFSLRASQYWASGKEPRPGTVRRLFDLRAFVGALVRRLGRREANDWLTSFKDGRSRLEWLASDAGFPSIVREGQAILFAEQPIRSPRADTREEMSSASRTSSFDSDAFTGEPRRPRRPST